MLVEQSFVKDHKQTVGPGGVRARPRRHRPTVRPGQGRRGLEREPRRAAPAPATRSDERTRVAESRYRRVVLKLSGEAFADPTTDFGIDARVVQRIAEEVAEARAELGVEIAIVVGGGNICRGHERRHAAAWTAPGPTTWACSPPSSTPSRSATPSRRIGQPTRVQTAITMSQVAEPYIPLPRHPPPREGPDRRSSRAGTGNPYFTTDTTAALRAAEIGAEAMLKGTHSGVDGVYTRRPARAPRRGEAPRGQPLRGPQPRPRR